MSSVILNSENNLSQCKKNLNMESDKVSDDSLFSSLFVIISDNNEESFSRKLEPVYKAIEITRNHLDKKNH